MRLYVGNLSKQVTEPQLNELAAPYGALLSAAVVTERDTGESKGFGFLEFATAAEGNAAIAGLNGRDVNGQALTVTEARPRKQRGQY